MWLCLYLFARKEIKFASLNPWAQFGFCFFWATHIPHLFKTSLLRPALEGSKFSAFSIAKVGKKIKIFYI